jgi:flagellar FliJ protein
MKKFSFKLEKILKIKQYNENIAKEEYGRELQKKVALEIENREMETEIVRCMQGSFAGYTDGEVIKFEDISASQGYIDGMKFKMLENDDKKTRMEPGLQKLKEKLLAATREKKTYEKLKEKAFLRYKEEYNKYQVKSLDEVAGHKYFQEMVEEKYVGSDK